MGHSDSLHLGYGGLHADPWARSGEREGKAMPSKVGAGDSGREPGILVIHIKTPPGARY